MKKEKKTSERTNEFSYIYKGSYITVAKDKDDLLYYAYVQKPGEEQWEIPGMAGMQNPTAAGTYAQKHIDALGL